jgi:hypothetical protein
MRGETELHWGNMLAMKCQRYTQQTWIFHACSTSGESLLGNSFHVMTKQHRMPLSGGFTVSTCTCAIHTVEAGREWGLSRGLLVSTQNWCITHRLAAGMYHLPSYDRGSGEVRGTGNKCLTTVTMKVTFFCILVSWASPSPTPWILARHSVICLTKFISSYYHCFYSKEEEVKVPRGGISCS